MFTREDTKALKGVAIILMLFHHLTAFRQRFPVGFEGFPDTWYNLGDMLIPLASTAKICVTIFFFLGGYGLYKRCASGKMNLAGTMLSLLKKYWKVFVIFIPVGFLFFARTGEGINALTTRFNPPDSIQVLIEQLLSNFLTIKRTYNSEWWFLNSYLCALPLGYLFCHLPADANRTRGFLRDIFCVVALDILIRNVIPGLQNSEVLKGVGNNFYFSNFIALNAQANAFFVGIVFAKYDTLDALKSGLEKLPCKALACLLIAVATYLSEVWVTKMQADVLTIPLLVASMAVVFDHQKAIRKGFVFLGHHSTNIWLIHTFYCYYFLEATHIVYCTQIIWVDLLILLMMSLVSSVLLELSYKGLGKVWRRLNKHASTPPASAPAT